MYRFASEYLKKWESSKRRKPLVIRGARQVGKTYLVRAFAGEHFDRLLEINKEPELHYWVREKKGSSAEVDYVIAEGPRIVPIEVKAGKSGTLKSLQIFIKEKRPGMCVRFNSEHPSFFKGLTTLPDRQNTPFRLLSLPLYMVGQTRRLIAQAANGA